MLLLDEHNQIDVPGNLETKMVNNISKPKTNLLSEIAEEDDVSNISETLRYRNGIAGSGHKNTGAAGSMMKGSFSNNSKASIHSLNNVNRVKNDGDSPQLEQKRRSQMINAKSD